MILLIFAAFVVIGLLGLILGIKFGMMIGREMAETQVIDYTNKNPLHYGYELSDTLYPHRKALIIEVPTSQEPRLNKGFEILREYWKLN